MPHQRQAGRYVVTSPGDIVSAKDVPLSMVGRFGWFFASRAVWPKDALLTPVFSLWLGRVGSRGPEALIALMPWLLLAFATLVAREAVFRAPGVPLFFEEWAFWFVALLAHILLIPVLGLGQIALVGRVFARYLRPELLEELSLCPNIRARDLVYGVGARLAIANSVGVMIWILTFIGFTHYHLFGRVANDPVHGISLMALLLFILFTGYSARTFSDYSIAVATMAYFSVSRQYAMARALRSYLFAAPILFPLAPFILLLIGTALVAAEVYILAIVLLIASPVILIALVLSTEQDAANRLLAATAVVGALGVMTDDEP